MERYSILVPEKPISPWELDKTYGYIYIVTDHRYHKSYLGQHNKPKYDYLYYGGGNIMQAIRAKHNLQYMKDNFSVKIIDWARSAVELDDKEKYWIEYLGCQESDKWYNIAQGGEGCIMCGKDNPNYGKPLPEEQRQKISETMKRKGTSKGKSNPMYGAPSPMTGKHHTEETKEKLRKANAGKKRTPEQCRRASEIRKGKPLSEKAQKSLNKMHNLDDLSDRISNGLKNSQKFQESVRIFNSTKRKVIYQYTKSGELVNIFSALKDAADYIGCSDTSIGDCCRGKTKSSHGYIWSFTKLP